MTISPDFSTAALVLAAPLVAYLVVGEPWLGRRMYASLERRRDHDGNALTRYFIIVLGMWSGFAAVTAAVVATAAGVDPADVGLTAPDEPVWSAVVAVGFAAVAVWGGLRFRRLAQAGRHVPGQDTVAAMLPRTPVERGLAAAVAVVEGVSAELVYRGLLIALGVGVLGLHPFVAAGVALLVYAAAGAYKGTRGVALFALFGFALTALYVSSGSLLLPMVVHVALTLRDLLLIPAPDQPERQLQATEG